MFGRYEKYSDEDGTIVYKQKERNFNYMTMLNFKFPFTIRRETSGFIVSNAKDGISAWVNQIFG